MNGDTTASALLATLTHLFKTPAGAQTPINPLSPRPKLSPANTPQRLTITVSLSNPDDLKVKKGQGLKRGELIADREREGDRLIA